jgi:hypothetical protein
MQALMRALQPSLGAALAGVVWSLALHGPAVACDKTYAASAQFSATDCVFQNAQNPKAQPSQPPWRIWSRFLQPANPASTPVDPIPVRKLDRDQLDALDPPPTTSSGSAIRRTCSSCAASTG